MRIKLAITVLLLGSIFQILGCRLRPAARAETDPAQRVLRHGGRERTYVVRVPSGISRDIEPIPLVIVLHGGGGNAGNAEAMTGFTAKGTAERFIVAYPEGTSRRRPLFTWNAGHCCGYAMEQQVDDVGFISALIDELSATHRVDRKRVYVTGMSNGAMMAHRLGIELSDRIAAIAPVVGTVFGDEPRPRSRVSALMINGMLDDFVPYLGGPPGGRFREAWDGTPTRPAVDQARFWAQANGCRSTRQPEDRGTYLLGRHDCDPPIGVEMYSVKDNGHAWPGGRSGSRRGDTPSTSLNGTDIIWAFFQRHPKP